MNRLFVACELGEDAGRVVLGTLSRDRLTLNEAARFDNVPAREKDGLLWNIAQMYQDVLAGLQRVGAYDEPVESMSCTAWGGDYLLFHADASFIPPTFHHEDARTAAGRASLVVGTHTHVQTADEQIFPGGTAYLSDAGFTGPHDGCLGREIEPVIKRFLTGMPQRFEVARNNVKLHGALIRVDDATGKATSIQRVSETV